ncbi:ubiquitin-like protein 7 [Panonychus citri]|uniref:ubiquitin-like protein 7 n=1 Tax=Panonychus citri TaxID=50023 RepID=UPI0023079F6B|nr:ubiquitin-like protein 7 [Panonychus citri]
MLTLYVCSKTVSLTSNETVKLDLTQQDDSCNDNNKLTVDNLMVAIKEKLSLTGSIEDYQLVCYGKKLKGDKQLSHYGIKSNAVVHLFLKSIEERTSDRKMDDSDSKGKGKKAKFENSPMEMEVELHTMAIASKTALMNKSFRQMLSRLLEADFRNNLIQCTPGLKDDLIAIAALHDAELLSMLLDSPTIKKVLDKHPAILEAATHLATAFHEENATSGGRVLPSAMAVDSSQFISYSLDDLSEDDDMTGGVDAPPPNGQHVRSPTTVSAFADLIQQAIYARRGRAGEPGGSQQSSSSHPPTPSSISLPPFHTTPQLLQQFQLAQLQAHHQHQQQQQQQQQQQSSQQQTQQPPQVGNNSGIIDFEMLRRACQLTEPSTSQQGNNSSTSSVSNPLSGQLGATATPPQPTPQASSAPLLQSTQQSLSRSDMSHQIGQMRELGLTDENVCLQALIATNGDVQAAVELIFSETFHS